MFGKGTQDKPYQISPSSLSLFLDCPACFIEKELKLSKRPSGPMSQLPNGIDDTLRKVMIAFEAGGVMPSEFATIPELSGYQLAERHYVSKTQKMDPSVHYVTNGLHFTLTGKLDELFVLKGDDQTPDTYLVADYKTKRSYNHATQQPFAGYPRQVRIYVHILRTLGLNVSDTALLVNYYPTESSVDREVHPVLEFTYDVVDASAGTITPILSEFHRLADTFATQQASGTPLPKQADCEYCNYRA